MNGKILKLKIGRGWKAEWKESMRGDAPADFEAFGIVEERDGCEFAMNRPMITNRMVIYVK